MNNRIVKKGNKMFGNILTPQTAHCMNCSIYQSSLCSGPIFLWENLVLVLLSEVVKEKHRIKVQMALTFKVEWQEKGLAPTVMTTCPYPSPVAIASRVHRQ